MLPELFVDVVREGGAVVELVEEVVDSMKTKGQDVGVIGETVPFGEEEMAGCEVIGEGEVSEKSADVLTSSDVGERIVCFEAEWARGLDAKSVFTGPPVVAKSDYRGVNSRVNPTFEKSDTGDPFFDVSGGAVFRVESEVFVPSCSAHPLRVV